MNGNLPRFRIVASMVVALTVILAGSWLLHEAREVPIVFWLLATLAVGSVAGAETVTAIAILWGKGKGGQE